MEIHGQTYAPTMITQINTLIQSEPELSRRELSRRICLEHDWRSPNGNLKEMNCRKALLELDRQGVIEFPPGPAGPQFHPALASAALPLARVERVFGGTGSPQCTPGHICVKG